MKTSIPDLNDNYGIVTSRLKRQEPGMLSAIRNCAIMTAFFYLLRPCLLGLCCSQRLVFALVAMVGCTLLFILRNDTSFAIVCMTNMTAVRLLENRSDDRHDSGCTVENDAEEVTTKVSVGRGQREA